jgi:hypothetical protein
MEHPDLVRSRLDGERVLTRIGIGGDDAVLLTPTRTLVYRAEGLLSDESVSAYPHDVERLELRSGRRKTTFRLAYVDGVKDFTVPSGRTHEVLVPLLTAVLRTAGVIEADESVRGTYRFSELTLVVTDRRVVKHVGEAVWDEEFEIAPYADLTGLDFEEGAVATEVSIEVAGYPQRVKVPNEHAGTVKRAIQEAAFEFHGVSSPAEFEATVAPDEADEGADDDTVGEREFAELLGGEDDGGGAAGPDAGTAAASTDDGDEEGNILGRVDPEPMDLTGAGTESDGSSTVEADGSDTPAPAGEVPPEVAERLSELAAAVERQNELLEHQGEVIRQLVQELRQGR